jgi:hypothetical protein
LRERAELPEVISSIPTDAEPTIVPDDHDTGWRVIPDAAASGFPEDLTAFEKCFGALESLRPSSRARPLNISPKIPRFHASLPLARHDPLR